MLDLVLDMETSDPDDFLTLLLALDHPAIRLRAVTLVPGTAAQVGVVRRALGWFGADIPVGASNLDAPKTHVSPWHEAAFGPIEPSRDAAPAADVLVAACDDATTLLTGGPLGNVAAAKGLRAGRWIAQGGFAGEGVVPAEKQLPKFRGLRTCETHNLMVDRRAAEAALAHPGLARRRFVSKNVCHAVVYDAAMHAWLEPLRARRRSLDLVWRGMDVYLRDRPEGKMLHDPFALACAIDESVAEWAEVELFREKNTWGARPAPGSGTFITVGWDPVRFWETLFAG